jgi:peptidase M28-like protein
MPASIDVVLDQHAGVLRTAPGPGAPRVVAVELLPATRTLLREASVLHIPLRVVVAEAFDDVGIAELRRLIGPVEAVAGMSRLQAPERPALLVAADRVVRARAAQRGWTALPHPALALPIALGETLVFARLTGDLEAIRGVGGLVPYWIERREDGSAWALTALTRSAVGRAIDAGLGLHCLPLDLELQDPLFVQLDAGARLGDALSAFDVLWADASRVLLALGATTSNDAIPAHGSHGHFRFLTPSPELLASARVVAPAGAATVAVRSAITPAAVTAQAFAADVARYAGLAPLDAGGALRSRHSSHPDNARAVNALLADLRELGYEPQTHAFAFSGRTLHNVVADLDGSGDVSDGAGLVVLGCHLDSTAARDPGYAAPRDPARGADDDASGMAALLAIARHLRSLPTAPFHTVRLCFFNAEESGLVGSRAYAASLKAAGAPVTGVVCCDMIAFNSDGASTFEIHAGFTDPAVRDLGLPLALLVADAARSLGELAPAQVYSGTRATGGSDRTRFDGAIDRSDHASFQEQGYPAVLVSEDFFPNGPGEAAEDPNPNYHSDRDAVVDADYGAAITRAVSVAVLALAAWPGASAA